MIFRFKKYKHRARPLYWLRWWILRWNPRQISYDLRFQFDSKYFFSEDYDQKSQNKLLGFGYLNPLKHSARFSYNYEKELQRFRVSAFIQTPGRFEWSTLLDALPGVWYKCKILISYNKYTFEMYDFTGQLITSRLFPKAHNRKLAILLGPYFGGRKPAPQENRIEIKNLKIE